MCNEILVTAEDYALRVPRSHIIPAVIYGSSASDYNSTGVFPAVSVIDNTDTLEMVNRVQLMKFQIDNSF